MSSQTQFRAGAMRKTSILKAVGIAVFAAFFCVGCGDNDKGGDGGKEDAAPTYIITFDADSGTVTPPNGATGADGKLDSLPAPVRTGYTFDGWFTAKTGGVVVTDSTKFDKDAVIYARWTLITHTIKFNVNGVGGTVTPDSGKTGAGGKLDSLPTPARTGYTFNGWFTVATGGTAVTKDTAFTKADTIYAQWTLNKYVITFNANGGAVTPASDTTGDGWKLASLPTPTRTGYTFDGWFTAATGGTAVTKDTAFTKAATLYAQWTLNRYVITFNANGGAVTPDSDTTSDGWKLASLPTPTKTGYTFNGWYTAATNGTAVTKDTVFSKDTTVYAQWTLNRYVIKFNATGGTITPASDTTGDGWKLASLPAPTRTGYTFNGWFTAETGGTAVTKDTAFTKAATIYAQWTLIRYVITFNANGGTVTSASDTTGDGWKPASLPTPTKTGYTFNGWFTAETGGTKVEESTAYSANATVYAQWTLNVYSVKFNSQSGSSVDSQSIGYGGKVTTPTAPARTGYTFGGWYKEAAYTTLWDFAADVVTSAVTLYAKWTTITYVITYNLDGGAVSPANPASYNIETAAITLNNPTKTGYTFAGWTGSNGETPQMTVTIPQGSTGIKAFTANWTLNIYTVTFNANGGAVTPESGTTGDGWKLTSLPTLARDGYTFNGWFTTETDGTKVEESTVYIANATVYAQWTWSALPYTITFDANGGTVTSGSGETGEGWKLAELPTPTRAYYTFMGWFTAVTSGAEVTKDNVFSKDATIYAQWTLTSYTITYDLGGGTVSPANPTSYNIESAAITLNNPTKTGYTFTGWTGSNGETPQTAVTIPLGSSGNKAYTAQWEIITYTMTYDLNGGTATNPASYTVETASFSLNNPTKTGYTFVGWTGSNGTVPQTSVSVAQGSTGNKAFTANWTITVIFNANGGSVNPTSGTTGGGLTLASLPEPTRTYYTFDGWYTAAAGGTQVTTSTEFSGNTTIYAQWLQISKDARDGKGYKWVTIGTQAWMAENLNYDAAGSVCYENSAENCAKYGRLYDWATAMGISTAYNSSRWDGGDVNHKGACPVGWHLPSDADWTALIGFVGGSSTAWTKLKSSSDWPVSGGTDDFGFAALPGGIGRHSIGDFVSAGVSGYWWSATEYSADYAWTRVMDYDNELVYGRAAYKTNPISVRCVQD